MLPFSRPKGATYRQFPYCLLNYLIIEMSVLTNAIKSMFLQALFTAVHTNIRTSLLIYLKEDRTVSVMHYPFAIERVREFWLL